MVGGSARHYELGPIALGLVKRNTPVDADLVADGIAASQEALVDPEVGLHVRPKGSLSSRSMRDWLTTRIPHPPGGLYEQFELQWRR